MADNRKSLKKAEEIIKYKKPKGRVILYGFLFLFGMFMFIFSFRDVIDALICGKLHFDMINSYIVLMFSASCLLLSIGSLLSYFGNKITISEPFIKIKRVALGKTYIISQSCIMAKSTVFTSVKGMVNYQVLLYLKGGKKINTGPLNCKARDFYEIDANFKYKNITNRKKMKEERAKLKNVEIADGDLKIKTNYLFQMLTFFPLIVLTIGIPLLVSGFNYKCGVQNNFHVSGIVLDKKLEKSKNIAKYKLVVLEDNTSEKYKIDVSSNVYDRYNVNSKIKITGTKGSLGIPYGLRFIKEK